MLLKDKRFLILIRYLILLALIFTLPLIYKILTPLTINITTILLKLFYNVDIYNELIIINYTTFILIIPACIAGSAYLLLLILNLTVPIKLDKRMKSIILSFLILFILNILRIFLFAILYHNKIPFVDFTHKFFWYFLSTIFVILIWFFITKKFSIKEIPVYTDFKYLFK